MEAADGGGQGQAVVRIGQGLQSSACTTCIRKPSGFTSAAVVSAPAPVKRCMAARRKDCFWAATCCHCNWDVLHVVMVEWE